MSQFANRASNRCLILSRLAAREACGKHGGESFQHRFLEDFGARVRLRGQSDASNHRTRLAVEPVEDVAEEVNSEEVDAKDFRG